METRLLLTFLLFLSMFLPRAARADSVMHPVSLPQELPATEMEAWKRSNEPLPIAKVAEDAAGNALYTRDVNRILCGAEDKRRNLMWLGCRKGVKQIDHRTGVVRHFGESEGLPEGPVVAIAADDGPSGEVWCLIRGKAIAEDAHRIRLEKPASSRSYETFYVSFPVYFCVFSPAVGKWKPVKTLRPPSQIIFSPDVTGEDPAIEALQGSSSAFFAQVGGPRIIVAKDKVAISLGVLAPPDSAQMAYLWERAQKRLKTIDWDAGLRSDNDALFTTLLEWDRKAGGLWIGTNVGLLYLAASSASSVRLLPDRIIGEGAAAHGGGVWVTTSPRARNDREGWNKNVGQVWDFRRVWGTAAAQSRIVNPTLPVVRGQLSYVNDAHPIAVTISADGAPWLTQQGWVFAGDYPSFGSYGLDAWWRRDPKSGQWTRQARQEAVTGNYFPNTPNTPEVRAAREAAAIKNNRLAYTRKDIPDAAAWPLAFYRGIQPYGAIAGAALQRERYAGLYNNTASTGVDSSANWMRNRFPEWVCASDLGPGLTDVRPIDSYQILKKQNLSSVVDSNSAGAMVWDIDAKDGTLRHGPVAAAPDSRERYPLPSENTISFRPDITVFSPLFFTNSGKRLVFITNQGNVISFDTGGGTFSPVPLPEWMKGTASGRPLVLTGDGAMILSRTDKSSVEAVRYDLTSGEVRSLARLESGSQVFGVAPNGGLWIRDGKQRIGFLEPGAAQPLLVGEEFSPSARSTSRWVTTTGFLFWTVTNDGNIIGYDAERKRRTPPLSSRGANGSSGGGTIRLLEDGQGGVYVAVSVKSETETASVYHYDRAQNQWVIFAPPQSLPPLPDAERRDVFKPQLLSVTDDEIWLISNASHLLRYDRKKRVWNDVVDLPAIVRTTWSGYGNQAVAAAENGTAFFIGGPNGLWRFDTKSRTWSEKRQNGSVADLVAKTGNGAGVGVRVKSMAVTPDAVFSLWVYETGSYDTEYGPSAFAARFDRRTHQWTFYDKPKGFPELSSTVRLITGGSTNVWLLSSAGAYRLDTRLDHWQLTFTPPKPQVNTSGRRGLRNSSKKVDAGMREVVRNADGALVFAVSDLAADAQTGDVFVLGSPTDSSSQQRRVVLRCDPLGNVVEQSVAPEVDPQKGILQGDSLLVRNGSVLIATALGVYRAFGTADAVWQRVTPPPGFDPGEAMRLAVGEDGKGLYVQNTDTVAYWASYPQSPAAR